MPPYTRTLAILVAAVLVAGTAHAADFDQRMALVSAQLERALERQSLGAPTAESETAVTAAIGAVQGLAPMRCASGGSGERRFLREWLAARLGPRANAGAAVWDQVLPDGARIALGAREGASPRTGMLLDALLRDSRVLERGGATDDLVLELHDVSARSDRDTRVLGAVSSSYAIGTRTTVNPEYVHRQTELITALSDVQRAEADDRADPGLLSGLSVLLTNVTADRARRDLARTPAVLAEPELTPYEARRTEARLVCEARAIVVLHDRRTGQRDSLELSGTCERRATGLDGVRSGDREGLTPIDAAAALPDESAAEALAFDDLRERARAPVTKALAELLRVRADSERRAGHALEALGLALLARDCGAELSPEYAGRLTQALTASPSQLAALERAAPATAPARSPCPDRSASRRRRTP